MGTSPRTITLQSRLARETALSTALLELLTAAEAAVDRDRQVARTCLARATALLQADLEGAGARQAAQVVRQGGFPLWQSSRLVNHIEENLGHPISSADLIALTRLSAGHFFRTFKLTFGESPCTYIAHRRVERAKKLMLTTAEPLCRIALDCGLCDQSHLTRLFRRVMGTTPKAWQREHAARRDRIDTDPREQGPLPHPRRTG
jgi:AraC-like DNA-binding protein